MKRHRRSIGDIQAAKRPIRRDAAEMVAMLPGETAETIFLRPKHQGKAARGGGPKALHRFRPAAIKADALIPKLAKLDHGLRQIAHLNDRYMFQPAAGSFGERAGKRRAVPLLHDETGDAKRRS